MKYKLTSETKVVLGVTLKRIKALKDFGSVKKGELGGHQDRASAQVVTNSHEFSKIMGSK